MVHRYNKPAIRADLTEKMVFVTGPRQIGKTTLAKSLIPSTGYLGWDIPEQRELILRREIPTVEAIVLDEIHKYRLWRQYLKGLYDQYGERMQILVTGGARLDAYRGGVIRCRAGITCTGCTRSRSRNSANLPRSSNS